MDNQDLPEVSSDTTGLLHLANEILLDIFHHLPEDSLFSLSLLCRRLHFICLPIFLDNHGIYNPTDEVSLEINDLLFLYTADYGPDVLSALQIALFIPRIDRLEISFPYPSLEMSPDMIPFRRLLRRIHALVSKLTSIRSFTLFLHPPPFNTRAPYRPPKRPRSSCVKTRPIPDPVAINIEDALQEVSSIFLALFTDLLQKSCTEVNLDGDCPLSSALPFWGTGKGTSMVPLPSFGGLSRGGKSSISSFPLEGLMCHSPGSKEIDAVLAHIPPRIRAQIALRSMKISSAVNVVIPPFSFATSAILRTSDLRELTLSEVHMEKSLWMVMLPALIATTPRLEELSITNCWHIPTNLVFRELKRLPYLKCLTLCNAVWYDVAIDVGPSLPYLTKLCASLEWIFPFLIQFNPTAIPLLEELIVIPSAKSASIEWKTLSVFLPSLIQRLASLKLFPKIEIGNICVECGGVIRFGLKDIQKSSNKAVLKMSGNVSVMRRIVTAGWLQMFPASPDVLNCIPNIALQLYDADPSVYEAEKLEQFLSLFPKIQALSVRSESTQDTAAVFRQIVARADLQELSMLEVNGKQVNINHVTSESAMDSEK